MTKLAKQNLKRFVYQSNENLLGRREKLVTYVTKFYENYFKSIWAAFEHLLSISKFSNFMTKQKANSVIGLPHTLRSNVCYVKHIP